MLDSDQKKCFKWVVELVGKLTSPSSGHLVRSCKRWLPCFRLFNFEDDIFDDTNEVAKRSSSIYVSIASC